MIKKIGLFFCGVGAVFLTFLVIKLMPYILGPEHKVTFTFTLGLNSLTLLDLYKILACVLGGTGYYIFYNKARKTDSRKYADIMLLIALYCFGVSGITGAIGLISIFTATSLLSFFVMLLLIIISILLLYHSASLLA